MSATLKLKPAVAGTIVRDPETGRKLPNKGSEVPNTPYWRRRMADGSAVVVPEAKPAPAKSSASKPDGSAAGKPKS